MITIISIVSGDEIIFGHIIPSVQVVYTGKTAIMTCISSLKPVWLKHNNSTFDYKVISKYNGEQETIGIVSVNSLQGGVYYCKGWSLLGKPFLTMAEIYIGG